MSTAGVRGHLQGRRVLHVLGNSAFGGGSRVVLEVARAAKSEGASVEILTTNPDMAEAAAAEGLGVVGLDAVRRSVNPVQDLKGLLTLWRFLRRERYDLVHTHTTKAGVVGRIAARMARVPAIVHTVHGFAFHEFTRPFVRALVVFTERVAGRCCDAVVTVSRHHLDVAHRYGVAPADRLLAIPNGIPDPLADCLDGVSRGDLRIDHHAFLIIFFGRLAPQKGIEYLLQALAQLEARGYRRVLRLLIIGEGPSRDHLMQLSQSLGLHDSVDFLGFRSDAHAFIDLADLVVLPSLWEGLSIAVLEAMARGAIIVTTSIPSNLEVVRSRREALLVPPRDAVALADAIAEVFTQQSQFRDMSSAARRRYVTEYTVDKMADSYMTLYRRLIQAASNSR